MDVIFENVSHVYMPKTPFEHKALNEINLTLSSGSFTALIGHTGSGKSTLAQHVNGLLLPTEGKVRLGKDELVMHHKTKRKQLKAWRKRTGMIFQYPEHQLFGDTVAEDIAFGPLNIGMSETRIRRQLPKLLELVGLPLDVKDRSPFELSGGQMRRVAIAGVLAMEPEVLILDEPAAALDPQGHRQLLDLLYASHKEKGLTTLLVTHHMEDAAYYADEVLVMDQSEIIMKGRPETVFAQDAELERLHLKAPESIRVPQSIREHTGWEAPENGVSAKQAALNLLPYLQKRGQGGEGK
ncbi:energy-coupling factor transporter ATPase [Salsuginibacillus kocurii]|uniref:energy-coupling factor transporter ATPase n=1 Tax=Salsuginibacillus kocurii TaxID=427078 RepID=UPI00035F7885|nr:energy-coupling factor transporter ATPase [Salsuginibacillus kocurii]